LVINDSNNIQEVEKKKISKSTVKTQYSNQDLFTIGSNNKGYCFVTYATVFEAKMALIHYKPDLFDTPRKDFDSVLKLETTHMDWDKPFFMDTLRKIEKREQTLKKSLLESSYYVEKQKEHDKIREEYRNKVSKNYYKEILRYEQPKTNVSIYNT